MPEADAMVGNCCAVTACYSRLGDVIDEPAKRSDGQGLIKLVIWKVFMRWVPGRNLKPRAPVLGAGSELTADETYRQQVLQSWPTGWRFV